MTTMIDDAQAGISYATLAYWTAFGWYMSGALLRVVYKLLDWFAVALEKRERTLVQEMACAGQSLIVTIAAAFLWTGSHLWSLLAKLGVQLPLEGVAVTPLSSLAAGFFIEWLLVDRLFHWWKSRGERKQ